MITNHDEFLCHQIVSTFDHIDSSDRQWYERVWLVAHANSGEIMVDTGFGKYTNRNVMDAHGGVAVQGTAQYTVRASRELRPGIDAVAVGPLSYEVVEPLRKIHACLGENDYGVSFDIEFAATMQPHEPDPSFTRLRGAVMHHACRYFQLGHASGKVVVEGKIYDVDGDTWWAERDHSWGIRPIGVPPPGAYWARPDSGEPESGLQPFPQIGSISSHWLTIQFKDYGLVFTFYEGADGRPASVQGKTCHPIGDSGFAMPVTDLRYHFEYHSGTSKVKSLDLSVTTADGIARDISVRPLGNTFHLLPAGYLGGYRGWLHGKWMGPYAVDGERLDLTDARVLEALSGGVDDTLCEFRCGNDIGYGILESAVIIA
jgi:hypothetical protein